MAGGKETPRQKLIGMMYLVLTALLALQTNSAILLKFQLLDNAISAANSKSVTSAQAQIEDMEKKAGETKLAKDLARVETGKQVQAKTSELIGYIEGLHTKLIATSGGLMEDKVNYKNINAEDKVAELMIPPDEKKAQSLELKRRLDAYVAYIKQWVPNAQPQAVSGKEDPVAKNDEHQKNKNFGELNFEATPMVAALATLSQKENVILSYQAEALANISGQLGKDIIKFTKISPAVSAESKVVAAGTKYLGEMYITASSDQIHPTMLMDGRPIQVDPKTGKGKVEFTVTPGAYDEAGNAKKTWTGVIKFKQNGRDTSFTIKQEYIVAKPVVQVQSGAVQALYLNCGNKLNIQVPALGSNYEPSFTAAGAQVITGAKKGEITVVPSAKEVAINVSSNGNKLSTEKFNVRLIPKPEIVATSGGRPINMKVGVSAPGPRELTLSAKPDETFKTTNPDDARYLVTKFEVILARGKRAIGGVQQVTSNTYNLSALAAQAQAGDRYSIEVKEVKRKNFKNVIENVSGFTNAIMSIPLN